MRAVQVGQDGQARVVVIAEPVPGNRALVQMHIVGLCGTDSGIVSGKIAAVLPVILGHEGVGVVANAQPGGLFQVGQRVLVDPAVWCGRCRLCIRGHPNLCGNGGLLGRDFDGLFADYAAVADQQLLAVPDSISVADSVVEAVGSEATLAQAIGLAGHAGTVLMYGIAGSGGLGLPYYDLYHKELTIRAPRAATRADYQRAIDLVAAGSVQASSLVTATFDLSEAERALAEVGRPGGLKVLMTAA